MEFKERIATVIWWLGVVGALGGLVSAIVILAQLLVEPRSLHGASVWEVVGAASIVLLLGVVGYIMTCTIRYLLIGVFWTRPKITGPRGNN